MVFHPPVVLFNVLNQLRLDIWLSWNSDGLLHEWFIEVNFIYLQFQLLGDLEKDTFKQPVNANFKKILNLKSTNKNNNNNNNQLLKKLKKTTFGSKVAKNLTNGWNSSAASSYSMKSGKNAIRKSTV